MWEIILLMLVAAGAFVLVRSATGARSGAGSQAVLARPVVVIVVVVVAARLSIWYASAWEHHSQATHLSQEVPARAQEDGFVSASSCRSCHPGEFASWHQTFHRTMTQAAEPDAVQGDFNDAIAQFDGLEHRMFRRGDQFWARSTPVDSLGRRGQAIESQIVMTTGSHHYQIYWISGGDDRSLLAFPLAYLLEDRRWIPREAALVMPPHLSQKVVLWNGICIRCHSTHGQPKFDSLGQQADTSVADLGISCEACHGPGEAHVAANQSPARRYRQHMAGEGDSTIVQPERLDAARSSQVCGQCHSIASFAGQDWFHGHWNRYRAGQDLAEAQRVIRPKHPESLVDIPAEMLEDPMFLGGRFWTDGMVRVSGREYNGLIDSPCFEGGKFSCLSCHSMHDAPANDQLKAGMEGDQACFQCHESHRDNIEQHTHHAANSDGSRCYNCHMPHTTYGLLKAIRSHQISSPSVAATVATGRPNACNACHLDKSLAWTGQHLSEWYGGEPVELDDEQATLSAMAVQLLKGDAGQRALAAWSMGWDAARKASGEKWIPPYLTQLLDDPYPAVRYIAARSLRRIERFDDFQYDFVGSAAHRQEAQKRSREIWEAHRSERLDQTGGAILIDAEGRLEESVFQNLLKQRDDRDIDLKE